MKKIILKQYTVSDLNTYLDGDGTGYDINYKIIPVMGTDLINVIVPIVHSYEPTYSTESTCTDRIFLLSEREYTGSTYGGAGTQGNQYAFYAAGNSKAKHVIGKSANVNHWTRTRKKNAGSMFQYVNTSGSVPYNGNTDTSDLNYAPAFCV